MAKKMDRAVRAMGMGDAGKIGPTRRADARAGGARMEMLEDRRLLSTVAHISSVAADNRGQVVLGFDADLDAASVNSGSVQAYSAGADGQFGTGDDVALTEVVNYTAPLRAVTVDTNLPADTRYRLVANAATLRTSDGGLLDGEFNGAAVASGNGTAGGNFDIVTSPRDTVARFSTIAGNIDINLFAERTPQTVANFLSYANSGAWDGTFFHRSVPSFVIQGGGFNVQNDAIEPIPQNAAVVNEPGVSNVRGTIAMAKLGSDPNSATNQWFYNLGDNSGNLDNQNGGFTAFGQVTDDAGLAVMDAIAGLPRVDASGGNQNSAFNELPVRDLNAVQQRNQIDPASDVVFVNRVAMLMGVEATGSQPAIRVVGAGAGGGPVVRIFDNGTGNQLASFFAYDAPFEGGVRVATGDINGDGVADIITGTGPGSSHVKVFDGTSGQLINGPLASFLAFPGVGGDPADPASAYYTQSFTGGVYVASTDVNHDGRADLIVSADAGATPHVKVFSGVDGALIKSFFAYDPAFAGGVRVAGGDVNGDGYGDIITGAGSATPHVRAYSGLDNALLANFFAYDPGYQQGIMVGAGDVDGDGVAEIITGTGVGAPHVKAFNADGTNIASFFAYDPSFNGGVRVATADVTGDGVADIITGTGVGAAHTKAFSGNLYQEIESFIGDPQFSDGIYIAGA
jgi:cyclophilin family peptidyl-prolyl cis-trans isomerase